MLKTFVRFLLLLVLAAPACAQWATMGISILDQPLDYVTIRQKNDGYVLTYRASDNKWIAASSGGGAPSGAAGGDLTGSSYPNPVIAAGAVDAGKLATTVTNRLNPVPAAVGNIPVDAGAATPYTFIDGSDADTAKALFATGASSAPAMRLILATDIDELLALSDLTDVAGKSGTGSVVLMSGSPTVLGTLTVPNAALGSVTLADQTANATSTGILVRNGAQLSFHDGTAARNMVKTNDTRLPPTPSGAGKVAYDDGSAYVAAAAGTATTVLHGGAAPSFSAVVSADITNGTIAMADLADLAGLSVIGRSASGAAGVPAAITGTNNQILAVNSAGSSLAFVTVSGDLTNATGVFTIGGGAVTLAKMADLAANSVIGNSTGSSATPTALSATTAGLAVLSGATAAAQRTTLSAFGTVNVRVFTSGTTYTPTSGTLYCIVECVGSGGAGGGCAGTALNRCSAGGGGSGGYSRLEATVAAVTGQTITVGAGGSAGAAGANPGGNGNDSSVGSLCVGKGGTGGGATSSSILGSGGAGGVAGTGDFTPTGFRGGNGLWCGAVGVYAPGGNGAGSVFGGGGQGASVFTDGTSSAGGAGTNYGAGGGGGCTEYHAANVAGGAGSAGVVIITEFIP